MKVFGSAIIIEGLHWRCIVAARNKASANNAFGAIAHAAPGLAYVVEHRNPDDRDWALRSPGMVFVRGLHDYNGPWVAVDRQEVRS